MKTLSANGICKAMTLTSGARIELLQGLDLHVDPGESVGILGRSGSGKSSLLAILGLLSKPESGTLIIGGIDVTVQTEKQRAGLRNAYIGFVFQNYSLIGHLTAEQNVTLPLLQGQSIRRNEIKARVHDALDALGLTDRAGSFPRHLSGGEQQRVAIARALVRRPALLLADEPTGALDDSTATRVLDTMRGAITDAGVALILVTHDPKIAATLDRSLTLTGAALHGSRGQTPTASTV